MTTNEPKTTWPSRAIRALGPIMILSLAGIAGADGERDLTEKTGHKYVSNVSETTLDDITEQGYRMTEYVEGAPKRALKRLKPKPATS